MRIDGGADRHDEANGRIFAFFLANTPKECHRMTHRDCSLKAQYVVSVTVTAMLPANVNILLLKPSI
jgi:hypothetical protein